MLQTFIEKNRKLLLFYYWAVRVGGWLFLVFTSLHIAGISVALGSRIGDWPEFHRVLQDDIEWGMLSHVISTSLVALGIAQLIRYLLHADRKPDWILRNADKLLYTYAAIRTGYSCWRGVVLMIYHFGEPYYLSLDLVTLVIPIAVKLLVLVGVAELLRRLLPMIEESRTLV